MCSTTTSSRFLISAPWVTSVAESICLRQGVQFTNAMQTAETGNALKIQDDNTDTIATAVTALHDSITWAIQQQEQQKVQHDGEQNTHDRKRFGQQENRRYRSSNRTDSDNLVEKERALLARVAARVAFTGALALYQKNYRKIIRSTTDENTAIHSAHNSKTLRDDASSRKHPNEPVRSTANSGNTPHSTKHNNPTDVDSHDDNEQASATVDEIAEVTQTYYNTMLQGLLFAFAAFQEVHSMQREHYPARTGTGTSNTVGWDTLVLLHFVHHIPQVALHASGTVVDETAGHVVRSWRKLLVALQTVDNQETPAHSRRRGALSIVNGLLTMLFPRYNTHQCAALLQAVDHAESVASATNDPAKSILQPSQHMTSEMVTYSYYKGRMRLYERRFDEAHDLLRQAYHLLPPPLQGTAIQARNKQRVRFFLAVSGLVAGRAIPQPIVMADELIQEILQPLYRAVQRGDVRACQAVLEAHSATLRRRGVYLILQQAHLLCYGMLLARVHTAMGMLQDVDNSRVSIYTLLTAYHYIIEEGKTLKDSETLTPHKLRKRNRLPHDTTSELTAMETITEDRLTIWVARLIAHGLIRGYISHEHKTLVLSKAAPFPFMQQRAE